MAHINHDSQSNNNYTHNIHSGDFFGWLLINKNAENFWNIKIEFIKNIILHKDKI